VRIEKIVVIVSNSTWNVLNFRLPVIRALRAAGYRVVVLAPVDESVSALSQEPGLELVPLRRLDRAGTGLWSNLGLFFELWRWYGRLKPQLLIHYTIKPNIFGNLAAALRRIPSFCVVTGLGYTYLHRGWVQWVSRQLYAFSFRFARLVLFENADDRDLMVQQKLIARVRTRVVNGCGVDIRHFSPNGLSPQQGKTVFTFIGRLLADKGIHEFVAAARQASKTCPKAEFWIVGGLDERNPAHVDRATLIDWVQSGVVQYKGATLDVRPFIAQSNWVVLPSYREGLPRVLTEAMAMGKPIIATDTAGCRDTVEPGKNGFLVPVQDANALARTFEMCYRMPGEQLAKMGQWGRARAENLFESDKIGQVFREMVQEFIG
jgi:glycosyltransferase involved in cell wall biosynthesis